MYPDIKIEDPIRQCRKIAEELIELTEALATGNVVDSIEEYWDTVHALDQVGHWLQKRYADLYTELQDHVQRKNKARGLYKA